MHFGEIPFLCLRDTLTFGLLLVIHPLPDHQTQNIIVFVLWTLNLSSITNHAR